MKKNRFLRLALCVLMASVVAPSLLAQWPDYPTRRVPRLQNGQPNLSAAAPRTSDGKMDFSGIWENVRPGPPRQEGTGAAAIPPPPPPPTDPANGPPLATFFDIGAGFKDGLPMQPWAAELLKKRMADNMKDNPDAHCLPIGLTQLHMHPQPRKIIQTPDLIVIIYESNGGLRQIFMDGRPAPNNDPQPWWYGYSRGRWEGDTLVVETTHFRDEGWLDVNGHVLTDKGKMIERFRRTNFGTMEVEVTIDDPKAYTKPFTVKMNYRIMVDTELIEFICNENERSTQHFDK